MASTMNESIETRLFINGEWQNIRSGISITKEVVAQVQEADIQDVEDAVNAANAAFPAWRDLGTDKRGAYLRKLSQLILESNDELAKLETLSTGRLISQFFDASLAAELFAYFAGGGWTAQGTASLNTPDYLNLTVKQPYGVVALIIPWNFPLAMFAIEKANNSEFGLHAAVFTKDLDRAVRLAKALDAGIVGVNCTSPTNAKDTAFGGFKISGSGREGLLYSLDSFLETKSILIKTARL
ncbi:hypothetical protein DTO013E5_1525 [Penicillium roqueforti]|uniref:aldehyde dehydrogenase (NAD(+)) n=1 Tax=Penicillium roqueforti (strain FM164) TaxID=1365484 RepID=W6QW95_PENRF|nr:hypothetical protein DTO012A1_2052 [Penicillium roqueforti]CDM33762.1 Delta l-pyrroline-5-carboxylate synthetase [Penicillium roqueforti FM164]KAI2754242.1 hypothetical protein DTO013F2_2068 [Penicillium roqueforti]KAI2765639.1 hypothetical protein DTO012A8_9146 [Penicillium roqueforti]KAI3079061.1 hypothetical protein CBS147339_4181 [Penicillium roqueforti]